MRHLLVVLALTTAITASSGCSLFRAKQTTTPPATVPLRIVNHNFQDMTIYVVRDGQRNRLGSVTAASSETFLLTDRHLGQLGRIQLLADPLGTVGVFSTDVIHVRAGQRLEWTLENELRKSSLAIY